MNIAKVSSIMSCSIKAQKKINFNGHWGKIESSWAPYPYEGVLQRICTYYPDRDETLDEINAVYTAKAGGRTIFSDSYSCPYSIGSINYVVNDKKSWELQKYRLTRMATEAEKEGKYVDAIRYKLKIANILVKQHKFEDQYKVEQGIRAIYNKADEYEKKDLYSELLEYNPDFADDLAGITN